MRSLQTEIPSTLAEAVCASHIFEQAVKIDVVALCHVMDRLCGSFIIAQSFQHRKDGFHDVLLPRSWVADLIDGNRLLFKDTNTLVLFVPIFRGLLQQLYAGGHTSGELNLYLGQLDYQMCKH